MGLEPQRVFRGFISIKRNAYNLNYIDERFGIANPKYFSGTLQIEDNVNSSGNFISYKYYRLSDTFNLVDINENIKIGDKILIYKGNLLLDTGNGMYSPSKIEYNSQIKLHYAQNQSELYRKNQ